MDKQENGIRSDNMTRHIKAITVIIMIATLFREPMETLVTRFFVVNIMSSVHSTILNDIIVLILFGLIIAKIVSKKSNFIPSNFGIYLAIISSLIFLYYRITGQPWVFQHFSLLPIVKYLDIIFIAVLVYPMYHMKALKTLVFVGQSENHNETSTMIPDQPIISLDSDALGYKHYALNLADQISNNRFKNAFAIGVNGKWGVGKTSFLSMVKQQLVKNQDTIVVELNAWLCDDSKSILNLFFETIEQGLRKYHSTISRLLVLYSSRIESLHGNKFTRGIQSLITILTGHQSVGSLYGKINQAMLRIDKKLVIIIDDVDRLNTSEIMAVMKIIRNTGNFHNTVFLVAYDREYVSTAIQSFNPHNHDLFLEKIFQIEISLPPIRSDTILNYIKDMVGKIIDIPNEDKDKIFGYEVSHLLRASMSSIRDANRLVNSLSLNLKTLIGEIDYGDFMLVELLRIKYPKCYRDILRNPELFCELKRYNHQSNRKIYQIRHHQNGKSELLERVYGVLDIDKNNVVYSDLANSISDIFSAIFRDSPYSSRSSNSLSIIFPSNYNKYFIYGLYSSNLSEVDFSKYRSGAFDVFKLKIDEWIEEGLKSEVIQKLEDIVSFDSREDYEKIISSIFHVARKKTDGYTLKFRNRIGFLTDNLYSKLSNRNDSIVNTYYNNDREAFREFIYQTFLQAPSPSIFESFFLSEIDDPIDDSFPLTREDVDQLYLHYLTKHSQGSKTLEAEFWHLLHNCRKYKESNVGITYSDEVVQVVKEFVHGENIAEEFLFALIVPESPDLKIFSLGKTIPNLYGDYNKFYQDLPNFIGVNPDFLSEFKEFYQECERLGFNNKIKFEFTTINVSKKFED